MVLILVTAAFRTAVGSSQRRMSIATLGTIGGFALGVLVARPLSNWFGAEVSAITTLMGVIVGWAAAWPIPFDFVECRWLDLPSLRAMRP